MRPDGVFLHLGFDEYIAEPDCLGSTNKATAWGRREGYYWKYLSPYAKRDEQTDAQLFGECVHAALLEGMGAYETRFIVEPDKRDHPDALFTVPQIKAALKQAGLYPSGSSGFTKEDWAEAAEIYLPEQPVWDNLLADFRRRSAGGRRGISAEMDFAIRAMRDIATEDVPGNETMRELLSVGSEFPILAEVSFFYTDDLGQRHRARFDKLLPTSSPDLKTVGNWSGRELVHSLDKHIKELGYDIQCADYQIARRRMMAMIRETDGACIHGATEEEAEHLYTMAHYDLENKPAWAWIFFEKPTSSGGAPVLFPLVEKWGGPYHRAGFRKRAAGLKLYRECMERFGLDRPWGRVEPVHFTSEDHEPHITLGAWGWGPDEEAEGEREHFE